MAAKHGFSLLEIIALLIIAGVLAAVIIPNLLNSTELTRAQVARNNLYAIAAAQQRYYEDKGSYCVQAGCGNTTANLNTGLRLSITDGFSYTCTTAGTAYQCTASDTKDTLTLSVNANGTGVSVTCVPSGYCPP